jgi:hypothetical protein
MMNTTRTPQVSISEPISPKILYFGTPVALITSLNELEAVVRNFFEIGCQDERVIGAVAVKCRLSK